MTSSKRIFDVVLAIVGLIIAAPVMALIALCIRIDSPGSVLFSQKRLGKNGSYFNIHKFRKFPNDWGTKGSGVTTQGDVRMTSVGAFLERTKLDELPQLWNILIGEMSFVGPRPESTQYEDLFTGEFKELLSFVPGIFGPNQVAFRNESDMYPLDQDPDEFYRNELFPKKAEADIAYFKNANLGSDLVWLVKSVFFTIIGIINWKRFFSRHTGIVLLDLVLFQIAWLTAHFFRFDGLTFSAANQEVYKTGCWLIPLVMLPIMLLGGCYRHPIRYFSLNDVIRLVVVGCSAWAVAVFIQFGFFQRNLSVGILILTLFLFLALIIFPRLWRREEWLSTNPPVRSDVRKVLIYGAGQRGSALAKFLDKGFDDVEVVGFLDEDSDLKDRHINGFKVVGSWRDIDTISERIQFTELWVTTERLNVGESQLKIWSNDKFKKFKSITKM